HQVHVVRRPEVEHAPRAVAALALEEVRERPGAERRRRLGRHRDCRRLRARAEETGHQAGPSAAATAGSGSAAGAALLVVASGRVALPGADVVAALTALASMSTV